MNAEKDDALFQVFQDSDIRHRNSASPSDLGRWLTQIIADFIEKFFGRLFSQMRDLC